MGVKKINSLQELYDLIKKDQISTRISNRRFAVRFIFVNSFEELQKLSKFLVTNCNVEIKEITELIFDRKQWLTTDDIVNWIKKIYKDTVVLPLSEFLRFQGKEDFYITLKNLTEIERQNNIRIYIPLVGLWTRFEQEFWNNFYRKEEWAPIWKLETSFSKIVIYQINFDFDYENLLQNKHFILQNFTVVSTTEEWLNIWKKENIKNILSLSKPLSYFYRNFLPDQIFELKEVSNQKDFLENVFKIKVFVKFKENETKFWNTLLEEAINKYDKKKFSIKEIFLEHFNIRSTEKLTSKDFLSFYLQTNESYERWLVKNLFLELDKFKFSYLYKCFEECEELTEQELIQKLWLKIFNLPTENLTKEIFSERKKFLNFIHKDLKFPTHFVEEALAVELHNIKNYPLKKKLEYLTNITFTEKKYIILELRDINIKEFIPDLEKIYPELVYYLDWDQIKPDNEVNNWIIEYFKEYNYSKMKHDKSPKIEELINNKNKNKSTFSQWYYSLPKAELKEDFKYIWIDGLGAEWFPLLVHLFNKYGKKNKKFIKKKMLIRTNLPSITECNKYDFEKIEEIDNYIHDQNSYKYPDDLIKEIEIIEKIVKKVINLSTNKTCIVSDHGFSFLCLKDFGNFKKFNLSSAEHEGRCMWIDKENYKDDEYFIVWNVDEGNCRNRKILIALKHVSLNNIPCREVHGGATPEEVLVPYIIIDTEKEEIEYKINILNSEVWINNPIIRFKIEPHPLYIPEAFLNEQLLNIIYEEENDIYSLNLKNLKVGTYTITLKIGNKKHQINITIRGGFKERELL